MAWIFLEVEKPALKPVPMEPFSLFEVGSRVVHNDGHVEVGAAFYSVPHPLVGRRRARPLGPAPRPRRRRWCRGGGAHVGFLDLLVEDELNRRRDRRLERRIKQAALPQMKTWTASIGPSTLSFPRP